MRNSRVGKAMRIAFYTHVGRFRGFGILNTNIDFTAWLALNSDDQFYLQKASSLKARCNEHLRSRNAANSCK